MIFSVTNTAKVIKYARKGSVVVKKFIAHFRAIKLLFLLKIVKSKIIFVVKLAAKGRICARVSSAV